MDYDPAIERPKERRPMGLPEAPMYWPSEEEWKDPLGYIKSIATEGQKYSIIKVCDPRAILA
jgi:[histone H3]-trimethyl-L-lysine4 demethylase